METRFTLYIYKNPYIVGIYILIFYDLEAFLKKLIGKTLKLTEI